MRLELAAALVFAPVLLHAQAVSSAPSQQTPELQSKLNAPAPFAADAKTAARRVSTGVIAPKLASPVQVSLTSDSYALVHKTGTKNVKVSMIVDETGRPSHVKIATPSDPYLDEAVFEAVSHSRFTPGTVSNVPLPMELDLTVSLVAEKSSL